MPIASANGIKLYYDVHGPEEGEPLLLVMGLGAQHHQWDDQLVDALVDRGFRVVRFDNRDVGESEWISADDVDPMTEMVKAFSGETARAPYLLSDMAADAVGLLDHLGIDAAHVVGASMGGMIAQTIAIEHPTRVKTLTSIMSTTGDRDIGQANEELLGIFTAPAPVDRDAAIAQSITTGRAIGSPEHFDEDRAREKAGISYDRGFNPRGVAHQLLAILASGSRTDSLRKLDVPTLVVHGTIDPLVNVTGGRRTAEAIPGAQLIELDDMGHDLPPVHWPAVIEAIIAMAGRART